MEWAVDVDGIWVFAPFLVLGSCWARGVMDLARGRAAAEQELGRGTVAVGSSTIGAEHGSAPSRLQ